MIRWGLLSADIIRSSMCAIRSALTFSCARSFADLADGSNHPFCGEDMNQNENLPGCTPGHVGPEPSCTDPNAGLMACAVCPGCAGSPCPQVSVYIGCDATCSSTPTTDSLAPTASPAVSPTAVSTLTTESPATSPTVVSTDVPTSTLPTSTTASPTAVPTTSPSTVSSLASPTHVPTAPPHTPCCVGDYTAFRSSYGDCPTCTLTSPTPPPTAAFCFFELHYHDLVYVAF